jgi:hypothetical protein
LTVDIIKSQLTKEYHMSGIGGAFAEAAVDDVVNQYQYENNRWTSIKFDSNKYQRMVKDLEKAGINKYFAAGQGASQPTFGSGSAATGSGISTALAAKLQQEQADKQLKMERRVADATIKEKEQNERTANALEGKYLAETKFTDDQRSAIFFANAEKMSNWMVNNALQGKYNAEMLQTLLENVPLSVDKRLYEGPHGLDIRRMEKISSTSQLLQLFAGSGGNMLKTLQSKFTNEAKRRLSNTKKGIKNTVNKTKKGTKKTIKDIKEKYKKGRKKHGKPKWF